MDKKVVEAACLQLVTERQILRQLLCTSHNQHRRAIYFRQLVGVRRALDAINVDRVASMLRSAAKQVEDLSQLRRSTIPGSILPLLHGIGYAANLCREVIRGADKASRSMYAQLATGFFAPLALTTLSMMGRVVLNARVLLRALTKSWDMLAALRIRLLCKHRLEQPLIQCEARAMQVGGATRDETNAKVTKESGERQLSVATGASKLAASGSAAEGGRAAAVSAAPLSFGFQSAGVLAAPDTDEDTD